MDIFLVLLLVLLYILLGVLFYFLLRNDAVHNFRINLNSMAYKVCRNYLDSCSHYGYDEKTYHDKLVDMWNSIADISYDKMLYSFKPLNIETWLTKEQQDFLELKF